MDEIGLDRGRFESATLSGGTGADALDAARALRAGDAEAGFTISELCLNVGAVQPERLAEVYDALCEGWLGAAPSAPAIGGDPVPGDLPEGFFPGLWALVDDPDAGRDPADITVRTAALAGMLGDGFRQRVADMARRYPGVEVAAAQGLPPRFEIEVLAACPRDSLGGELNSLVVDKGFDLEVLDRDGLGLSEMPEPLEYLNIRILQCHDIWHIVAGYETTGLHEVAISGFQMAQFGHQYSSLFLGVVLTKNAYTMPVAATGFLLDTILSAYRHGRETPPMLPISWEAIWDRPIEEIRERCGIQPYDSPYPAGIIEQLRAAG